MRLTTMMVIGILSRYTVVVVWWNVTVEWVRYRIRIYNV